MGFGSFPRTIATMSITASKSPSIRPTRETAHQAARGHESRFLPEIWPCPEPSSPAAQIWSFTGLNRLHRAPAQGSLLCAAVDNLDFLGIEEKAAVQAALS
jgi:hypothetical protein